MTDGPTPLYTTIERLFQTYQQDEDPGLYAEAELIDVYVVGSAATEDFIPGESDLDLCILVDGMERSVGLGFDAFLMESHRTTLLKSARPGAVDVDVAVYNVAERTTFIDDTHAFSCRLNTTVTVGREPHITS